MGEAEGITSFFSGLGKALGHGLAAATAINDELEAVTETDRIAIEVLTHSGSRYLIARPLWPQGEPWMVHRNGEGTWYQLPGAVEPHGPGVYLGHWTTSPVVKVTKRSKNNLGELQPEVVLFERAWA